MYEENKVLQDEVDALKSLIEEHLPAMTGKMREEFEEAVQSLPSSEIDEEDSDD